MNDISISPYGFGNAPRGQDPMGQANQVSNQYQPHPMARFIGQMMDYLQDPRVGMAFPGAGLARMGFRAGNPGMKLLREADTIQYPRQGLAQGVLESAPTPYQQATTLRQGDNGMARIKAYGDLQQSNGWTDEQLREWMTKQSN